MKYFLKLLKSHASPYDSLVFTNFMTCEDDSKVWCPEDLQEWKNYKKTCIVGVGDVCTMYINTSLDDEPHRRASPFEYNWNRWGRFSVGIGFDFIHSGPLEKFLESVFTQVLLATERNENVFLGIEPFMKKGSSYEHMMNIDMMTDVE